MCKYILRRRRRAEASSCGHGNNAMDLGLGVWYPTPESRSHDVLQAVVTGRGVGHVQARRFKKKGIVFASLWLSQTSSPLCKEVNVTTGYCSCQKKCEFVLSRQKDELTGI